MPGFFPRTCLLVSLVCSAVLACSISACTRPALPPNQAVVLVELPILNLDPLKATDAVSQKIGSLIYSGLVSINNELDIEPDLAESFKVSSDKKRFEFQLRPNLVFHDGSVLGVQDVIQVINTFRQDSALGAAFAHIKQVKAQGAHGLVIETEIPQPFLLSDLTAIKIFKRTASGPFTGSGRFELVLSQGTEEVRLKRFAYYPVKESTNQLSEIVFRYVSDETTRYQYLIRGDGNVIYNALGMGKTHYLREHLPRNLQMTEEPGINYSYLCLNFRNPVLANLKVRQALSHALNLDAVLQYRIKSLAHRAPGILAPVLKNYFEAGVPVPQFDRRKAELLLDEAGYPRKGKNKTRFTLRFKTTAERYTYDSARIFAADLAVVGIEVILDRVDSATFFSDVKAGRFDLFQSRWVGVTNPSIYFRALHSSQWPEKSPNGVNRGGYSNAKLDKLIEQGMQEPSLEKQRAIFSQVQKLVAADLPYINLWHWVNTFIAPRGFENVVLYPNGNYMTLARLKVATEAL